MKPVDFPEANFTFGRPMVMTDEQCGSLRVFKGKYADGLPVNISCFELSEDELQEIVKTRRVWLHVIGESHPPVAIGTESPWKEGR